MIVSDFLKDLIEVHKVDKQSLCNLLKISHEELEYYLLDCLDMNMKQHVHTRLEYLETAINHSKFISVYDYYRSLINSLLSIDISYFEIANSFAIDVDKLRRFHRDSEETLTHKEAESLRDFYYKRYVYNEERKKEKNEKERINHDA